MKGSDELGMAIEQSVEGDNCQADGRNWFHSSKNKSAQKEVEDYCWVQNDPFTPKIRLWV